MLNNEFHILNPQVCPLILGLCYWEASQVQLIFVGKYDLEHGSLWDIEQSLEVDTEGWRKEPESQNTLFS